MGSLRKNEHPCDSFFEWTWFKHESLFRTLNPKNHFKNPCFIRMMSESYMLWCVESPFQISIWPRKKFGYSGTDCCTQMLKKLITGSISIYSRVSNIMDSFDLKRARKQESKQERSRTLMSHVFQFHIKNCSCNLYTATKRRRTVVVFPLQFFWLAYSTVAKRLQIGFFGSPTKSFKNFGDCNITPLERSWVHLL